MKFAQGALLPFAGFVFLARRPRLWPHAWMPALLACALLVGFSVLGLWLVHDGLSPRISDASGVGKVLPIALYVLSMAASVLLAFALSLSLAQPLSGPSLEILVRKVHEAEGVALPGTETTFVMEAWRSLRVNLFGLALGLPPLLGLWIVTLLWPPLTPLTFALKFAISAAIAAWDFLDYPLSPLGYSIRQRLRWMRAHQQAVLGFGAATALLLMIPLAGLLVLPSGVVGAAMLRARVQREAGTASEVAEARPS